MFEWTVNSYNTHLTCLSKVIPIIKRSVQINNLQQINNFLISDEEKHWHHEKNCIINWEIGAKYILTCSASVWIEKRVFPCSAKGIKASIRGIEIESDLIPVMFKIQEQDFFQVVSQTVIDEFEMKFRSQLLVEYEILRKAKESARFRNNFQHHREILDHLISVNTISENNKVLIKIQKKNYYSTIRKVQYITCVKNCQSRLIIIAQLGCRAQMI